MLLEGMHARGRQGRQAQPRNRDCRKIPSNITLRYYILSDDDTPTRLQTCYVSLNFEKDNEVLELEVPHNWLGPSGHQGRAHV